MFKKMLFIAMILVSSVTMAAQPSQNLINKLIQVESNGDDRASGDNGNAIGCLQLWASYVNDACWGGLTFTLKDRYSRQKSIAIFKNYMARYATDDRISTIRKELSKLEKRDVNLITTDEIICRMHNGGLGFCYMTKKERKSNDYSGRNRRIANTAYYWSKVQNI